LLDNLIVSNSIDIQISATSDKYVDMHRKDNTMLSTIVMTLLAIWLSLLIVGQVIGGYCGYKFFKAITDEDKK